jgi:hypothetical protein
MKKITKIALALMVGVMAIGFSAFTNAKNKLDTTWHISSINGSGNYVVTTSGSCGAGSDPCEFTTSLAPDQPGNTYSPAYLNSNGVTVQPGLYSSH